MTENDDFLTDLVKEMRRLAIVAGREILKIYYSDDLEIKTKSDASPVTKADELRKLFKDNSFIILEILILLGINEALIL